MQEETAFACLTMQMWPGGDQTVRSMTYSASLSIDRDEMHLEVTLDLVRPEMDSPIAYSVAQVQHHV